MTLRGEAPVEIPFETRESNMDFETEAFVQLIRNGEVAHRYLTDSEANLRVMDRARELADIRLD